MIELFAIPIMYLNLGAGIVGGVWLAVIGQWELIGIGLVLLITSHWILSLLLLPSLPVAALGMYLYQKKSPFAFVMGFLSQFYNNLLIVATCVAAYFLCSSFHKGASAVGFVPFLLWSWGMGLGPWQYMASKEPDNEFSHITIFSASAFYLLFLASTFVSPLLSLGVLACFATVQLLVVPIWLGVIANQLNSSTEL